MRGLSDPSCAIRGGHDRSGSHMGMAGWYGMAAIFGVADYHDRSAMTPIATAIRAAHPLPGAMAVSNNNVDYGKSPE